MEIKEIFENTDLRMIKLLPHGIADNWPEFRPLIEMCLPPLSYPMEVATRMTGILEALVSGKMELHVFFKYVEDAPFSFGFIVTTILSAFESDVKNLLIYAFYGHRKMLTNGDMMRGIDLIKKYARGVGCKSIVAYSNMKPIIELMKSAGANVDYTMISLEA